MDVTKRLCLSYAVLVALLGACATSSQEATRRRHLPDDVGELVWTSLKKNDYEPVFARFDPTMVWSLPSDKLKDFWSGVAGPLGELRSWSITEQSFDSGRTRLVYDLLFSGGRAQGVLAINQGDFTIAGLFVTPERKVAPERSPLAEEPPGVFASLPGVVAEGVRFGKAPWEVDGIVTRPRRKGTFPAAVLVAGSGPLDRDSTVGENRPFRDLAEGLSRAGMVVLRFDKRTFTHAQKLNTKGLTVDQEVIEDALSGLALLRARPDVRKDAVFVVGHSLGALLAPEIAQRDGNTAGLVLLAPPGRPITVAAIDQLRFLNQVPPEELARLEKTAAAIDNGTAPPDETFLGAPASYFIDLGKRDGIAIAKTLARPILILRGSRDYQSTEEDLAHWQRALAGQPAATTRVLPGLNHLFMTGKGPPTAQEYLTPGKVAPALMTRVSAFVKKITTESAAREKKRLAQEKQKERDRARAEEKRADQERKQARAQEANTPPPRSPRSLQEVIPPPLK